MTGTGEGVLLMKESMTGRDVIEVDSTGECILVVAIDVVGGVIISDGGDMS